MTLIITGPQCRFCNKVINDSIANAFGDGSKGFICPDCIEKQFIGLGVLGQELTDVSTIECDGQPLPCPRCGKSGGDIRYLHLIDRKQGLLCPPCSDAYIRENPAPFWNTEAAWELKLR